MLQNLSSDQAVSLDKLKAELAGHHQESPQRAKLADMALEEVRAALAQLAALGHTFHLVSGPGAPPVEWPRMYYHEDGRDRVVGNEFELADLGPGWHDHPAKAMQAAGTAVQFAGRGGVQVGAGALAPLSLSPVDLTVKTSEQLKAEFLAERQASDPNQPV